ncbi:MAG TPA: AAA family ATPase [Verrucomicrobiae bacterium]|nr:AAA family ATPase [Verrucomicrobiae bacterium]
MTARGILTTTAFVLEHNKRRLLILLGIAALVLFFYGIRSVFEGLAALVGQMPGLLITLVFYAFAFIAQFGALMWFLSRPRTYTVTPDDPQIGLSFNDYRGQPDLVEHAKTLVRILGGVERFKQAGGEMPKGMLLSGQPGTGKTFLAGVIAAEARLPFIYIDASSLRSMWMGVDALVIISLFRKARGLARKFAKPGTPGCCILFMDEIDSIGMSRGGVQGGQQQGGMGPMGMFGGMGMSLNTLLNQMDSLNAHVEDRFKVRMARWLGLVRGPVPPKPLVFVIGATNRPDTLDIALTRPGRLDRSLIVYPPDGEGRKDILQHYLAQKAHDETTDVDMMAQDSIGWTPIHIKTIINEALIVAHEDGRDKLSYKDWLSAADMRFIGLKQPIHKMSAEDKRAVAYHEAGHAVANYYLRPEDRMKKASIIRRGETLGVVSSSEREERHQVHARQYETDIMVSLGSRAVEELILGTKLQGASSDLQQATRAALTYVARLGMGSTLMVAPANAVGGYPETVLIMVDNMLQQLFEETKRLMKEKEYAVHAVAGALMQREELIGAELDEIFKYAEEANPEKASPFVRKPLVLPTIEQLMKNGANGHAPGMTIPIVSAEPGVPGQPPVPGPLPPIPVPPHPEALT